MIHYAAWPNWMIFVIIMAAMGPLMRVIFGDRAHSYKRKRLERSSADDVV